MSSAETRKITDVAGLFDATGYPDAFLAGYTPMECLAHGHGTETFVVRAKTDGTHYIAKCYDLTVYPDVHEDVILSGLCDQGFPAFIESYRNSQMHISIREYIVGEPLDRYVTDNRLSQRRVMQICDQLCSLLRCLHEREQPIIHRDIKPQNVIIRPDGQAVLIDFDIARQYQDGLETDTQTLGTRYYAPPEQYGFTQTDARADIYSFGVLMRFLMTHCDTCLPNANSRAMRRIIERCTAFAPQDRFENTKSLQKALWHAREHPSRRVVRAASVILAVGVLLGTGFTLGRFTTLFSPVPVTIVFHEPLIEAAVRIQLGVDANEQLTTEKLNVVRKLFIFGTEVAEASNSFPEGLGDAKRHTRGDIVSLHDFALLPNLEEIELSYQRLEDLSGIETLPYLQVLCLRHTNATDLTPLSELKNLRQLSLYDTNVSDLSSLARCEKLSVIDVGATLINRIENLTAFSSVQNLYLSRLKLQDLQGIDRFTCLKTLDLRDTEIMQLDGLQNVSTLDTVYASGELHARLTVLLEGTGIAVIGI